VSFAARSVDIGSVARAWSAAALLAIVLASCAFDSAGRGLLPPFDATHDAALDIRADGCGPRIGLGSGSMIAEYLAVTAAHVVAGSDRIELRDTSGGMTTADVVSFDPDLDLAILRTDDPIGSPIRVRPERAAIDEVGVVALPRRDDSPVETEVVDIRVLRSVNIRTTDIYLDDPVERRGFEIEATIDPGDSGALVVLPGGGVGVVWARSNEREERAWAVDLPSELIDPGVRAALSDPATPLADVGDCIRSGG
jgi:S1-C subfamily serine protease